jgi:hypothetical protein
VIQRAEAQAFADENGMEYIETSAKSAEGVDEAFISTAERIWDKSKNGGIVRRTTGAGGDDTVNLGGAKANAPYGRKKCCS